MKGRKLLYSNKTKFIFVIWLILLSTNNCILEIPIKRVKVNSIVKKQTLKEKEKKKSDGFNPISLITEKVVTKKVFYSLCTISIGSNDQQFNLILDTTSSEIIVMKIGGIDIERFPHQFSPRNSQTFKDLKKELEFESNNLGDCDGTYAQDTFKFINEKAFSMKFGLCDDELDIDHTDGIMGLGRNYDDKECSIIYQLKKYGIIDSLSFSIKFDTKDIDSKGKLYLGKHQDFLGDNTIHVPLSSVNTVKNWTIQINGFGMKNAAQEVKYYNEFNAALDTSSNEIKLPMLCFEQIKDKLNELGCQNTNVPEGIQVSCDKTSGDYPDLILNISQKFLILPGEFIFPDLEDIIDEDEDADDDFFPQRILFVKDGLPYSLGTPFFYAYHILFDEEGILIKSNPIKKENVEDDNDEGISTIVIILIVVGSILLLFLIVGTILIYRFKCRKKNDTDESGPIIDEKND